MINMDDYRKEDGHVDWEAYEKARVDAGEKCMTCGSYISLLSRNTGPVECYKCRALAEDSDAIYHSSHLRCPKCKHSWEACGDYDDYDRYEPGDHDVECPACEHEFMITTRVEYNFESPALEKETADV